MKKIIFHILAIVTILLTGIGNASAQEPTCDGGVCPEGILPAGGSGGDAEGLTSFYTVSIRGGYVAAGVGLRNTGSGTIKITGIPTGASVYKAFLYWNIVDEQQKLRHKRLVFKGTNILGEYVGGDHQTCWLPDFYSTFSYRADVTSLVTGNGNYPLSGVDSGRTDGADPSSSTVDAPLAQGASLVVIYSKPEYPRAKFFVWDGATTIPGNSDAAWITLGPLTATNPVGPARTTYIVADGQSSFTDFATVNNSTVTGVAFDGTDPRAGASFMNGNLWDTQTAWVGRHMSPGDTSVKIGITMAGDCLTWVAQVFSMSNGTLDTDGDALLDGWETSGYDFNGDHVVDVDLPLMGASPFHKDIFVEHDWMTVGAGHDHKPSTTVLNRVTTAFAQAPVSNPDGKNGIRLHNDFGQDPSSGYWGGNQVTHQDYITTTSGCGDMWTKFDTIKNPNFDTSRQDIFHYAIWGHDICPDLLGTSGYSRGIPANDFLVTLGSWSAFGSEDERTGTFMHELGHNVGLTHGGASGDHDNYKPNHLSVMNYSFQTIGVWRAGARRWDYTRMTIDALDENNLSETAGLNGSASLAAYGTRYYCPATTDDNTADTNVDWNCNGTIQAASVVKNIDGIAPRKILGAVQNQWANLIYNGGTIGLGTRPSDILDAAESINFPCLRYIKPK